MSTNKRNRRSILKTIALVIVAPMSMLATALRTHGKDKTPLPEDVDVHPAGPMVGHTTENTSSIWMYAPTGSKVAVKYGVDKAGALSRDAMFENITLPGMDLRGEAWGASLDNLQPETQYAYEVSIDGKSGPTQRGSFRTGPAEGKPSKFRLALTSCMLVSKPADSWSLLARDKPDLHLTLGDTIYADSTDPKVQWRYHLRYRRVPQFAEVLRNMPTYAIWDDHDFGPDNSDRNAKGKEHSLASWKRLWHNPSLGTDNIPGAFFKLSRGDVDFFVVDGRYHRSPNKDVDDAGKTMFCKAQFNWLIEGLKNSKAKFKIIATGSTLHHSLHDGMRLFTHERHNLFGAIKQHKIAGVVFMTGSLHNSLIWEHHESELAGYPMVEIISSGIANGKRLSYATIDFDTTIADPTMTIRIVHGTGKVKQNKMWKLSTLTHA